jgi:hypothetical protein
VNLVCYMILKSSELEIKLDGLIGSEQLSIQEVGPNPTNEEYYSSEEWAQQRLAENIRYCRERAKKEPEYEELANEWQKAKVYKVVVSVKAEPV